jgi:hypothetical protein
VKIKNPNTTTNYYEMELLRGCGGCDTYLRWGSGGCEGFENGMVVASSMEVMHWCGGEVLTWLMHV